MMGAITAFSQAPDAFTFQAVIRDATNNLVTGTVGMQISIATDSVNGSVVYSETHTPTANANGLVSVQVGAGTIQSGVFADINWGNGPFFIKSETDPTGGTSYSITGGQQLASVPYALHAGNVESLPEGSQPNDVMAWDTSGTDHWVSGQLSTANIGSNQAFNIMNPYQVLNWCISLYGTFPSYSGANPFIAELMLFAGNFAPVGWTKCDGQLLPISQNTAMFSLMGTMYGGDGETTFGMPDLRGRVPIHHGFGPGLPSYTQGAKSGNYQVTLISGNLPSHNHPVQFTSTP